MIKVSGLVLAMALAFLPLSSASSVRAEEDAGRAVLEEGLGLYSMQCVYFTYLNIGLIGDGVPKGVYDEKKAQELLQPVINMIGAAKKQNEKLLSTKGLSDGDKEYIKKIQKVFDLLEGQATELKAYIATKEKANLEQYDSFRQLAWKKIEELIK